MEWVDEICGVCGLMQRWRSPLSNHGCALSRLLCCAQVMLGAGAVLSNGTVISRVGSAAVAMMAAAERIPVLVCWCVLHFC